MNKQLTSPRFLFSLLYAYSISLLIGSVFSPAIAAPQPDACALLKPADLKPLLGGKPTAAANERGCLWTASGNNRKLIVLQYRQAVGVPSDMAFMGAQRGAAKGGKGKLSNEDGLGDKAFASLESFGVSLVMLKQGRLLQLQYWTEAAGTAKDIKLLRPVAKKAVTAY